jgi:hypothetical protein
MSALALPGRLATLAEQVSTSVRLVRFHRSKGEDKKSVRPDLRVVPVAAQRPQGAGGGLARVDLVAHVGHAFQQPQVCRPGV